MGNQSGFDILVDDPEETAIGRPERPTVDLAHTGLYDLKWF